MSKLLKKFCGIFGYKLFKKDYIKSKRYLSTLNKLNLENIIKNLAEKKTINYLIKIVACDGINFYFLNNQLCFSYSKSYGGYAHEFYFRYVYRRRFSFYR